MAYIIAPAFPEAVGRVVQVVRLASGDPDKDGVRFDDDGAEGVVWVVRGHEIPWGESVVNIFAIEGMCLRKLVDPPGHQLAIARVQGLLVD